MIDLSGKRAFVTGGGRGIGRAAAVLLARAGAAVALGFRSRADDAQETLALVRETGAPAVAIAHADVVVQLGHRRPWIRPV